MTVTSDEAATVKWVIELEGGPAFAGNAATACRIAARDLPYLAAVFKRLETALREAKATTGEP